MESSGVIVRIGMVILGLIATIPCGLIATIIVVLYYIFMGITLPFVWIYFLIKEHSISSKVTEDLEESQRVALLQEAGEISEWEVNVIYKTSTVLSIVHTLYCYGPVSFFVGLTGKW